MASRKALSLQLPTELGFSWGFKIGQLHLAGPESCPNEPLLQVGWLFPTPNDCFLDCKIWLWVKVKPGIGSAGFSPCFHLRFWSPTHFGVIPPPWKNGLRPVEPGKDQRAGDPAPGPRQGTKRMETVGLRSLAFQSFLFLLLLFFRILRGFRPESWGLFPL